VNNDILNNVLFKDLIEFSNDMIWILNFPGMSIEYVNQTTCDEMGYTLEQMQELGMGKLRKSLPEAVSFSEHIEELHKTEDGMTDYAILVRSDGSEFYIEVKARIIDIGGSTYNLAIVRNISDRIEMLKKIEEESKKAQSYLDISKVIIMALDNNKNIVMVNQAGCELLGYTKEELIGENFVTKCIPESIQEDIEHIADDIIKSASAHSGKLNDVITKRGEIKTVSWKNSTLLDNDGNAVGILTSGEDITELAKIQKEFFQQAKQAQMGEMISMIAHQWRQPLGAISSTSIDLNMKLEFETFDLKEEKGREECQTYFNNGLKDIDKFVKSLTNTIDDFRNFYKPNKQSDTIKLEEVCKKSLAIIKTSLINNNINIIEDYCCDDKLNIYTNEMTQVVLNILKNSQDNFLEKDIKNPYIKITTKDKVLSICDNGGGIPDDIMDKVFDPYFSTKDEKNGTGLGLYMSKTIIEEHHNATLTVKNTDGGVCFMIEFV